MINESTEIEFSKYEYDEMLLMKMIDIKLTNLGYQYSTNLDANVKSVFKKDMTAIFKNAIIMKEEGNHNNLSKNNNEITYSICFPCYEFAYKEVKFMMSRNLEDCLNILVNSKLKYHRVLIPICVGVRIWSLGDLVIIQDKGINKINFKIINYYDQKTISKIFKIKICTLLQIKFPKHKIKFIITNSVRQECTEDIFKTGFFVVENLINIITGKDEPKLFQDLLKDHKESLSANNINIPEVLQISQDEALSCIRRYDTLNMYKNLQNVDVNIYNAFKDYLLTTSFRINIDEYNENDLKLIESERVEKEYKLLELDFFSDLKILNDEEDSTILPIESEVTFLSKKRNSTDNLSESLKFLTNKNNFVFVKNDYEEDISIDNFSTENCFLTSFQLVLLEIFKW